MKRFNSEKRLQYNIGDGKQTYQILLNNFIQKNYIIEQLEAILLKKLIYYYKILNNIICNRRKLFIFNY